MELKSITEGKMWTVSHSPSSRRDVGPDEQLLMGVSVDADVVLYGGLRVWH